MRAIIIEINPNFIRENINNAIIQSGLWNNTKTTNIADFIEINGKMALPIVEDLIDFYPKDLEIINIDNYGTNNK